MHYWEDSLGFWNRSQNEMWFIVAYPNYFFFRGGGDKKKKKSKTFSTIKILLISFGRKIKQIFKLEESSLSNSSVISDIVEIKPPNRSFLCVEFIYFVCSCMLCCLVSNFLFTVLLTYGGFIVKLQLVWTSMPAYHDINL